MVPIGGQIREVVSCKFQALVGILALWWCSGGSVAATSVLDSGLWEFRESWCYEVGVRGKCVKLTCDDDDDDDVKKDTRLISNDDEDQPIALKWSIRSRHMALRLCFDLCVPMDYLCCCCQFALKEKDVQGKLDRDPTVEILKLFESGQQKGILYLCSSKDDGDGLLPWVDFGREGSGVREKVICGDLNTWKKLGNMDPDVAMEKYVT
uniref:Uncharacterized protein n=1 Tax=Tanacetum cinerariifolium TaxID=118510 RepID=A0A6L2P0H4_TANCI|nr:hypothetical protein [Tanacetum cinerariifolium]